MHTLPKLVGEFGEFALPLADATAERLVDGLICPEMAQRRGHFRAAIAGDAALAVWAVVRAQQQNAGVLSTCDELSQWLALQPIAAFRPDTVVDPTVGEAQLAEFSEPAGCSLAVAELAGLFAQHVGADVDRAYLLGLVHLAPAWLAEAAVEERYAHRTAAALPSWLIHALTQISLPAEEQTPEIHCVSRAMALVCSDVSDDWRAMGCDATHWIGRWAVLGEAWGGSGRWATRLAEIVGRLETLGTLQTDFSGALLTAKLEAMKELAYGAGHEINNPLANISARAQTLLQDETDPERRRTLAAINSQAFRAHEMIADMMLFARPPRPNLEECDLAAVVRELASELSSQAAEQHVEIRLQLPETTIQVFADSTQIAVAVRSLIINSLEAMPSGGHIQIELRKPKLGDDFVRILVTDDGPGIAPEIRPKIFDPFYSGREAGRGLGLGLSKCWRIIADLHQGKIEIEDCDGPGVRFIISLPARIA